MLCLNACAPMASDSAVQAGTKELRRNHANALVRDDVTEMRDTGEKLLTALACGWNEQSCAGAR